ncbi:MAG: hypothetical protein LBR77_08480 [Lachnospiraceae bacterium]|jgi:hypothetical protein|nr:hypothetical protein [Lachnospiraceae bacterium]
MGKIKENHARSPVTGQGCAVGAQAYSDRSAKAPVEQLDFARFIGSLFGRIAALCENYGGGSWSFHIDWRLPNR